ncbi:MAG: J domain-containing protein [Hyphomicrobium sp.]|uniref:J domain-containing protein n=1 Tax=Hyphomicrobium sp. TaxID=82 RepID=UPI0039E429FD
MSRLQGRFILPGFGKTTTMQRVTSEMLSRDAVIEPPSPRAETEAAPWVTVVDPAEAATSSGAGTGSGDVLKVAGVVSTLLVSLMGACLLLVRRRQYGAFEYSSEMVAGPASAVARIWELALARFSAFRKSVEDWRTASPGVDESFDADEIAGLLESLQMRLHETEYSVSALPRDLLLRDVLTTELDGLHERVADMRRRAEQMGAERLRSAVRAIMRDLDRIGRIVEGAMPISDPVNAGPAESEVPTTAFEAYRVLGLNTNAPDAAVKKIVDALRMSWHPDHARDDADRRYREQRIKQINAAWDLLKTKTAAAA